MELSASPLLPSLPPLDVGRSTWPSPRSLRPCMAPSSASAASICCRSSQPRPSRSYARNRAAALSGCSAAGGGCGSGPWGLPTLPHGWVEAAAGAALSMCCNDLVAVQPVASELPFTFSSCAMPRTMRASSDVDTISKQNYATGMHSCCFKPVAEQLEAVIYKGVSKWVRTTRPVAVQTPDFHTPSR
jgi:hypothetical protein